MAPKIKTKLGQVLCAKGVAEYEIVQRALDIQKKEPASSRRKIGDILVNEFGIDRDKVYSEIAQIYGFRKIVLNGKVMDMKQREFIKNLVEKLGRKDKGLLHKYRILPYEVDSDKKDILVILAADPTDSNIPGLVLKFGYNKFDIAYARPEDIDRLIEKVIPQQNEFLQILDDMTEEIELPVPAVDVVDEQSIDAEIHQSKLTNLVEGVLIEAVRIGASDIHIIPRANNQVEFLFRIDGKLKRWHIQENTRPEAVSAVVKDRSKNVDRFEREKAQDGYIQREIDDHMIRFRVSILPIVGVEYHKKLESIVIRVLDDRKVITDLEKLGLQRRAKTDFVKVISRPQGMVILTGPTGSGKSTTLVAAINHVNDPSLNILTVEDPVEYIIDGVRQLKIGHKMNFDQAMRSILRHDPDIVMVGEIRDLKTAEIGIKLANTGHLTFSTLHTNDAPSAISRLYKMGVEPFLIAYAINIIVAQRLIRTLCPKCKKIIKHLNDSIPRSLGFSEAEIGETVFFEPVGCDECNNGFAGRAAIHETLLFTKEIRNLIVNAGENIDEDAVRQAALDSGMQSLRMSGKERIKQGITTCEEVGHATIEN